MDTEIRNKKISKTLATNINSWRTQNNLSKRKLSNICHLAEATIRNVEYGVTNIELLTLVKLRLGFNVELNTLFDVNSIIPKIRSIPINPVNFEKAFKRDKFEIGKRLNSLQKFRGLDSEMLSVLSNNIDYSDTLKYQRGEENIELLTLLKYADGLEVDLTDILDYTGEFPNTKFKGKIKE